MASGIQNQNKTLADAAKTPKDTSHRTVTSNRYAARIASNKNSSSGSDQTASSSTTSAPRAKINSSDKIKGSWEGLDKGARADIVMNNTGYLNDQIQTARKTLKSASHKSVNFTANAFTGAKKLDIINNNTMATHANSSSSKIKEIVKRNNYIK